MPDPRRSDAHSRQDTLEHLLAESRALRERSIELANEVERLRSEMEATLQPPGKERRRKPRLKGK